VFKKCSDMRRPYHKLVPPPIKRSKILVSGGVAIVMSVKLYLWLLNVWLRCLWLRVLRLGTLPENPFLDILRSGQKVAALWAANNASERRACQLSTSSFHFQFSFPAKLLYSLPRTNAIFSQRLQGASAPLAKLLTNRR